jgi:hypothetical protein
VGWTIDPPVLPWPTNLTGPETVVINTDFDIMWDAPGGGVGEDFFEDFEGGTIPTGWLAIDQDGDGYNWENSMESAQVMDAYEGTGCIASASYVNDPGLALNPNNYLITPPIEIGSGSVLTYYHDAQDPAYADDFYYVKLSTTGTAIGDFSETLWSGTTPADWTLVSIDLDDYAGNTCYIAFQHTNCTDEFWMKLDNVAVSSTKTKSQFTPPVIGTTNKGMPFRTTGMSETEIEEALANYSPSKATKALLGYNVYRKFNTGSWQLQGMVTETMYTGNVPIPGAVYTYRVTAVYDEGESDPSNEWAIDAVVGVEEYVSNATQLYPNPATNAVSITSDFNMESVTVYNFAGQVVLTQKINNTTYRVNTSNFDAGIYLFQIQTEEGRIAKRVVIE